jgi:hypothetical protein
MHLKAHTHAFRTISCTVCCSGCTPQQKVTRHFAVPFCVPAARLCGAAHCPAPTHAMQADTYCETLSPTHQQTDTHRSIAHQHNRVTHHFRALLVCQKRGPVVPPHARLPHLNICTQIHTVSPAHQHSNFLERREECYLKAESCRLASHDTVRQAQVPDAASHSPLLWTACGPAAWPCGAAPCPAPTRTFVRGCCHTPAHGRRGQR